MHNSVYVCETCHKVVCSRCLLDEDGPMPPMPEPMPTELIDNQPDNDIRGLWIMLWLFFVCAVGAVIYMVVNNALRS